MIVQQVILGETRRWIQRRGGATGPQVVRHLAATTTMSLDKRLALVRWLIDSNRLGMKDRA